MGSGNQKKRQGNVRSLSEKKGAGEQVLTGNVLLDQQRSEEAEMKKQYSAEKERWDRNMPGVRDGLLEWLKKPIQDEYKHCAPRAGIIVRIFFWEPVLEEKRALLYTSMQGDRTVQEEAELKILPIAKILAVCPEDKQQSTRKYVPGDHAHIPDTILNTVPNPAFEQYMKMIREQPSLGREFDAPPRYVTNISQWSNHLFMGNKFKFQKTIEDAFTFLIPDTFLVDHYFPEEDPYLTMAWDDDRMTGETEDHKKRFSSIIEEKEKPHPFIAE